MKFIIATTIVPSLEGGLQPIADNLYETLREFGHDVELFKFPFHSYYSEMTEQMLALRFFDLSEHGDRLIALRTPSYLLQHPHKYIWFFHHHRGAYDLWGTQYQDIPDTIDGNVVRDIIVKSDQTAFSEAEKIYSVSDIVSARLLKYNNISSEVLTPPVSHPERYYCSNYGDYIFYPSRITPGKRQNFALEAMQYTKSPVKLVIAGYPENLNMIEQMNDFIKVHNLENKVEFLSKFISEKEKIDFFAGCLAVLYLAYNEDSWGYVSSEAHHSKKAVIALTDGGGTDSLIIDGSNGFIVEPDPRALAEKMDIMFYNKKKAKDMGCAGEKRLADLNVSWHKVLEKFTL